MSNCRVCEDRGIMKDAKYKVWNSQYDPISEDVQVTEFNTCEELGHVLKTCSYFLGDFYRITDVERDLSFNEEEKLVEQVDKKRKELSNIVLQY